MGLHHDFFDDEDDGENKIANRPLVSLDFYERIKAFTERTEIKIAIGIVIAALIVGYFFGDIFGSNDLKSNTPASAQSNNASQSFPSTTVTTIKSSKIKVYITGEIQKPGVYEMENNSRLTDLFQLAGNITINADLNQCNLASFIVDGMKIVVPAKGETQTTCGQTPSQGQTSTGESSVLNNTGGSATTGGLINLNSASQSELESLPGVGPSYAKSILDYRSTKGGFKSINDLKNVKGIGDKRFEDLKDLVTI